MLKQLNILFFLTIVLAKFAWAATPESTGLHLSFEQRLAVTYALMTQGESAEKKQEILNRAKKYFYGMFQAKTQTVKVKNFQEFLTAFKGPWPGTHSVALDLDLIEKQGPRAIMVFESDSARVQSQINRYLDWQRNQLKKMALSEIRAASYDLGGAIEQFMALLASPQPLKMAEQWALNQIEVLLTDRMKELDHVGEKIATSSFAQQQDATLRILMQTMFSEYFSNLSPASKKLIASSYLGGDLRIDDLKKFEIMVQNSGPPLQKLLQVVALDEGLSPEVVEIFHVLENSVRPVPWVLVSEILNSELTNYKFIYFERKPLGIGSVAQVHRAKILVDGVRKDVVVRFNKPGIAERIEEDRLILAKVAKTLDANPEFRKTGAPKLDPIVEDIIATVTADMNQDEATARQRLAKPRYEKTVLMTTPEYKNYIEFHVPIVYSGKAKSKFMIQELIIGKKLDKEVALYADVAPQLKRGIVEEMAKVWAHEVLFGSGLYHSDLHQGNFMVQLTEPKIRVNILDYGMGGVLDPFLQRQVMVLGAGLELNSEELISRAYWKISQPLKNSVDETHFRALVQERLRLIQAGKETRVSMENWTTWAMDSGLRLSYEFISLNRGIGILNKLLKNSGSKMSVMTILQHYARTNPAFMYKTFVLEENMSNLDMIKLGWADLHNILHPAPVNVQTIRCEKVFQ
jgi:predicted unusual protein kinase regulating ubiquinone biosynthesis (AarF/ABC1/UbiB family)